MRQTEMQYGTADHAGAAEWAATSRDAFVEVVSADDELMRAEFDAIVAANWPDEEPPVPTPPQRRAGGHVPAEVLGYVGPAPTETVAPAQGSHLPGRQRSPPGGRRGDRA